MARPFRIEVTGGSELLEQLGPITHSLRRGVPYSYWCQKSSADDAQGVTHITSSQAESPGAPETIGGLELMGGSSLQVSNIIIVSGGIVIVEVRPAGEPARSSCCAERASPSPELDPAQLRWNSLSSERRSGVVRGQNRIEERHLNVAIVPVARRARPALLSAYKTHAVILITPLADPPLPAIRLRPPTSPPHNQLIHTNGTRRVPRAVSSRTGSRDEGRPASRQWGCVVLSIRRMTLGSGYRYLMESVAAGDGMRHQWQVPRLLRRIGTPPGVFLGAGLAALDGGGGVEIRSAVREQHLFNLLGMCADPITGQPLGRPPIIAALVGGTRWGTKGGH